MCFRLTTYHCSGALVSHVAVTSTTQVGFPHALSHFGAVVENVHERILVRVNIGTATECDGVVAAGDGCKNACLNVHCPISTSPELQNVTDMADVKILEGWGKKCGIPHSFVKMK